ncbi:MAG TPA: DUF4173 domain-containing protein, partial [Chloroflexota bacterium]|nr:DUF4173 domain-containing protein [Chloroflexota bacterium]
AVTMGLLLALDWLTQRSGARQVTAIKWLSLLLVVLVLVILASAFQRMSLYESAYGFTSLRVYTHWFMLWMAALFVLKAAAQCFERGQIFAFGGFVSLIVALAGFNLLNPDAFIAEQNLLRYLASGKIDTDYAIAMSADAAPIFMAHLEQLQGPEKEKIGGGMKAEKDDLYRALSGAAWPSYHLARKQALDALLAKSDVLHRFKPVRARGRGFD